MLKNQIAKRERAALALGALFVACAIGAGGLARAQQTPAERAAQGTDANAAPQTLAALRSPDAATRAAAAYRLSKQPAEARAALSVLVELLADAALVNPAAYRKMEPWQAQMDLTVGHEAAGALVAAGSTAFEPLVGALERGVVEARRNAVWALGALRDERATEALCAALKSNAAETRTQAAWALGAIRDARAVMPLTAALADGHAHVRAQAAWALGAIGDARAADALRGARNDGDAHVRQQVEWALSVLSGRLSAKRP
ncbi:MAG TPA: HEAT repeat domain-containing protein [Pyrinomonadaceae bacterium]|jgi:HEAT repeat protein